ncbi:MAG: hypothetical protein AMXMBFR64_48790 [Myxococcales bacterium]
MSTQPLADAHAPQDAGLDMPARLRGLYGGDATHRRSQRPDRMAAGGLILTWEAIQPWLAEGGGIEIEVGFGLGRFLVARAAALPHSRLLGFEVQGRFCRAANVALEAAGLTNTRIVQADARPLVAQLPEGSVDAIHVGFPDPWWKKRHHRRRVFTPAFIDAAARVLRPGGVVTLRTDVEDYARDVVARFAEDGRFAHDELPEGALPPTDRELRCAAFSLRVHRHRFTRTLERSTSP